MATNAVPGFLPSRYGFRFANSWPANAARSLRLGRFSVPIGDTRRGLCGGMAFAARDRFERHENAPPDDRPPKSGTPLFDEIVDRQFASFGPFFLVPIRFWLASAGSQENRTRGTVRDAWPEIKAAIDAGTLPMVGIVRLAGWNPLRLGLGHQVVAYRYEETATDITIGIYDPNHPGRDDVTLTVEREPDGSYAMRQHPQEKVIGLLALPFVAARR